MTRFQRIKQIISAVFSIMMALIIMAAPTEGYDTVIFILACVFILRGITNVAYYFSMSRFMVGGRTSLYIGVILLNLGILTTTLSDVPHYIILAYLIAIHAFSGAVEVLRAFEARRLNAGSWKLKMGHGLFDMLLAGVCIIFLKRMNVAVEIYAFGILYSSVVKIITSFRKTKFVYIQ